MFSLYISVVEGADNIKTFVGTLEDFEPMEALAKRITEALGFGPEGLLDDLITTPLYHTGSDEYRVCLTYNTFFIMTLHDDDKARDIYHMLNGFRTDRLAAPPEIVTAKRFEDLLQEHIFTEEQEAYKYAKELHEFHCKYVCVDISM